MSARVSTGAESKQDYSTPPEFIAAVERRFGPITFDLAAHAGNAKSPNYFTEEQNALVQDWHKLPSGLLWLNPPFANIAPWAEKCRHESERGARIAFLVPASVGSRWFADHVFCRSRVHFLSPRLSFDGKHPYPKDCILCLFSGALSRFECWNWRGDDG